MGSGAKEAVRHTHSSHSRMWASISSLSTGNESPPIVFSSTKEQMMGVK